jgi:hypothetical protein
LTQSYTLKIEKTILKTALGRVIRGKLGTWHMKSIVSNVCGKNDLFFNFLEIFFG